MTEVTYLLATRLGADAEVRFLGDLAAGNLIAEPVAPADWLRIAELVARRKSNKEIAQALQISVRTVSTHLSNIFLKLNVDSRGELADHIRGITTQ